MATDLSILTQPPPGEPQPTKLTPETLGGLRIEKAIDKPPFLNVLIYGDSGIGKTVMCGSATMVEAMSPVLILDVEGGVEPLRVLYPQVDVIRIKRIKDLQKAYDELFLDKHPYKTIVLDSLTEIQKLYMSEIMINTVKEDSDRDPDVPGMWEWNKNHTTLDTLIPTPNGWAKMGSLLIGSEVFAMDGSVSKVTDVIDRGFHDCYEVTFSDSTKVECSGVHGWAVKPATGRGSAKSDPYVVRSTNYMAATIGRNWRLPNMAPAQYPERELPVHPYFLGLWLADGSCSTHMVVISSASGETIEVARKYLPEGYGFTKCSASNHDWRIDQKVRYAKHSNSIREGLRYLSLWGTNAYTKFIPQDYLHASIEQRTLLLQGLMDGDGWVETNGRARFATISDRLADGYIELVQSLGGYCSGPFASTHKLMKRFSPRLPNTIQPFQLGYKAEKYYPSETKFSRGIVSIKPIGKKEAQCISIDHGDHLYGVNGYILTHNSSQVRKLVRAFRDLPVHTIFTALADEREYNNLKKTVPSFSAKLIGEIPAIVDLVLYFYTKTIKGDIQRFLLTQKTEKVVAKDRTTKLPVVVEEPTFMILHSIINS